MIRTRPGRVQAWARIIACAFALAVFVPAASSHDEALFAATIDPTTLSYLPVRYSSGEEVIVQALLRPEGGERLVALDLKRGENLRDQGDEADPELRELRVSKAAAGWTISWRFVPWSPGSGVIPAMRVKGMSLPSISFSAPSLLGPDDRDPSPPRRQRDPPGTVLYLYGLVGLLLLLVLGGAGTAAYLVPAARALLARRRAALAFKRFAKSLDYLAAEADQAEPAYFFAALSRAFRLYLGTRVLPEAPALTAVEIETLPEEAFPAPATKEKAAALVALADKVRYGGDFGASGEPTPLARRAVLMAAAAEARSIAEANEEALLARL